MVEKDQRRRGTSGGAKLECSKCGKKNDRLPQRYCTLCHAEYMRANRKPYAFLTVEQKRKDIARSTANVAVARGKIFPEPCADCGAEKTEKHHEDYDKPLEVTWLCRTCHLARHKKAA